MEENAELVISDPQALENAKKDLRDIKGEITYIEDPYKAVSQCHAIAILTEWDLYRNIDYEKVFSKMKKPAFVFDGRNILNHKKLFDMGFNVYSVGRPPLTHFRVD
jgi:UDPglucose 6-dehydrogenase